MAEMIGCPKCGQYNTAEFWDKNTKEQEGIKDDRPFTSAGAPIEQHQEDDTFFRCPICNDEVNGVDLIRKQPGKENNNGE